jgi:hypothetical protein
VTRFVQALVALARWVFVRGRSQAESQARARDAAADARRDADESNRIADEYERLDIEEHARQTRARNDVETSR